jgi:hypothetical protein
MWMEQSALPLIHLYILKESSVMANEPDMNFKLKMLVAANFGKFRHNALVSDN